MINNIGRFISSDGYNRMFKAADGTEDIIFIGTRSCLGDLGGFHARLAQAEESLYGFDNLLLYNELSTRFGAEQIRVSVSDSDFLSIEDALVLKIQSVWEKSVDSGLKDFVRMMDGLNTEVTEEMIAQIILPYLDKGIGETFYMSPGIRTAFKTAIKRTWTAGKAQTALKIGIPIPRAAYIDTHAQTWLRDYSHFWLRHRWDGHIRNRIAQTAKAVGIDQGLGRREVGRAMAQAFKGVYGENAYYWELVGSHAVTKARSWSNLVTMDQAGIESQVWATMGDERVCPVCGELDGTVVSVRSAMQTMQQTLEVDDYVQVRALVPSINYSPKRDREGKKPYYYNTYNRDAEIVKKTYFGKEKLSDGKWLASHNMGTPQAHPGCRCTTNPGV